MKKNIIHYILCVIVTCLYAINSDAQTVTKDSTGLISVTFDSIDVQLADTTIKFRTRCQYRIHKNRMQEMAIGIATNMSNFGGPVDSQNVSQIGNVYALRIDCMTNFLKYGKSFMPSTDIEKDFFELLSVTVLIDLKHPTRSKTTYNHGFVKFKDLPKIYRLYYQHVKKDL